MAVSIAAILHAKVQSDFSDFVWTSVSDNKKENSRTLKL